MTTTTRTISSNECRMFPTITGTKWFILFRIKGYTIVCWRRIMAVVGIQTDTIESLSIETWLARVQIQVPNATKKMCLGTKHITSVHAATNVLFPSLPILVDTTCSVPSGTQYCYSHFQECQRELCTLNPLSKLTSWKSHPPMLLLTLIITVMATCGDLSFLLHSILPEPQSPVTHEKLPMAELMEQRVQPQILPSHVAGVETVWDSPVLNLKSLVESVAFPLLTKAGQTV